MTYINNKSFNFWKFYINKVVHLFKDGFNNYTEPKYIPFLNFDPEWVKLVDGQKKLEESRLETINTEFFEIKRFAQLYTKKIFVFKLEINKYIERNFFDSVLLHGILCAIYTYIPEDKDNIPRVEINHYLEIVLNKYIDLYFEKKNKKKIKKEWYKLTLEKRKQLIYEILHILWANLTDLKIIKVITKKVFDETKREWIYVPCIEFHPDFDKTILGIHPFCFNDFPCIDIPKDWEYINKNLVYNGGYHTFNTEFIQKKIIFTGESSPTPALVKIINKLQQNKWTIDPVATHPYFIEKEFKNVLDHLQVNSNKIKRNEDIFQAFNTMLFIQYFCTIFDYFYFVHKIDFRGRIYSACDWAFSPSSSKQIRKFLRLPGALNLNLDSINWLYLKIGKLLDLPHKTNKDLLLLTKAIKFEKKLNATDFNTYTEYQIQSIINDIENKESNQLVEVDCTNSAMQILAILSNSKKIMRLTNLIGYNSEINSPESNYIFNDLYQYFIDICKKELPHPIYEIFLNRPLIKSLIMPRAYGKTQDTSIKDIKTFAKKNDYVKTAILHLDDKVLISLYNKENFKLPDKLTDSRYYENVKIDSLARGFYKFYNALYYREFPEIELLEKIFQGKNAPLRNFEFSSPYLTLSNKYNVYDTYPLENMKNNKTFYHRIPFVSNETDFIKESNASLANAAHFFDGWLNQYIIENMPSDARVYPVHDSWILSPNYISCLQDLTNEGFKIIQNYVKNIPELKQFHENGSIEITSKNIVKIDG